MHGSFSGTALHGMLFIEKRSGRAVSLFIPPCQGTPRSCVLKRVQRFEQQRMDTVKES